MSDRATDQETERQADLADNVRTLKAMLDAVQQLQLAQHQSHEVLLGQIGELGKRLDRLEGAGAGQVSTTASGLSLALDSLARLELAQQQSHAVTLGQISKLGKRLDRLESQWVGASTQLLQFAAEPPLTLNWRAELAADDADLARVAADTTREIVTLNGKSDLTPLSRTSPALKDFDWTNYLALSEIRVVRTLACLQRRGIAGRVLDMGSYFGNFSLALARRGFAVTALDGYRDYTPAFGHHLAAMRAAGISVADSADIGVDLAGFDAGSFDAVLCMSVIEHIPHTPRLLLEAIDRVLRPGGLLVMDTPNLAYEYQRYKLMVGQSVFAPIETQFETAIPFKGHHREYTPAEIRWIINRIGYRELQLELYSYSIYGLPELSGADLVHWRAMDSDPERRELIFLSARKPTTASEPYGPQT